jgi:LPS O-antigen subunit length determinant protein (WzzB/FepE family)
MNSNKNHQNNNEIDLSKLIISFWDNKFKIFIITAITIIIVCFSQITKEPVKPLYNSETQLRPITTFDEAKYVFYNSYLKKINENYFHQNNKVGQNLLKADLYSPSFSSLLVINKKLLLNLFIDKLNQNSSYIDAIKKYKLIKKENYLNNSEYEIAVVRLASSIKLFPPNENKIYWSIFIQAYDSKNIEDFLKFVEKKANQDIRLYLENTFKNQIKNEKKLMRYEIEDIDIQISKNFENFEKASEFIKDPIKKDSYINEMNNLKIRKNFLLANKNIERFEEIFKDTPITSPEQFYAAKIIVESSIIKNLNKEHSISKTIFLAGILGLILGIIFVFISNTINSRKK